MTQVNKLSLTDQVEHFKKLRKCVARAQKEALSSHKLLISGRNEVDAHLPRILQSLRAYDLAGIPVESREGEAMLQDKVPDGVLASIVTHYLHPSCVLELRAHTLKTNVDEVRKFVDGIKSWSSSQSETTRSQAERVCAKFCNEIAAAQKVADYLQAEALKPLVFIDDETATPHEKQFRVLIDVSRHVMRSMQMLKNRHVFSDDYFHAQA